MPKNYLGVQALRAVAATLVVLQHLIRTWHDRIAHGAEPQHWTNGAAGVDIFFVISGFVMAISLPGLAKQTNKARVFLWRRITRIVPLYWGATTLKIAILKLAPSVAIHPLGGVWRTVASYLFIPVKNGDGLIWPVVEVGWTLDYEMFFYLLFAVALALDLSPFAFLAPSLTALAVVGIFRPNSWPDFTVLASTLVIEFLFGLILAELAVRRKLPSDRKAFVILGLGFLALMLIPEAPSELRFLAWGLPAAAVVTGAVALEEKYGARLPRWLLSLGDASYALYLSHAFILPIVSTAIARAHLPAKAALVAEIAAGLSVSLPFAVLLHRFIERPLMDFFKKKRGNTGSASGASIITATEAA